MKLPDQFDEIQSIAGLRQECRSLLAQIKLHQRQITELKTQLAQCNELTSILVAAKENNSVEIPSFTSVKKSSK